MNLRLAYISLVSLGLLVSLAIWIFQSHMEANAFNAVTGKSVSTWQAMWIELRVQEQSQ